MDQGSNEWGAHLREPEMLTDRDRGWAAGIFDGEGSISLVRPSQNRHQRSYTLSISITNSDPRILTRFQGLLGGALYAMRHRSGRPGYRELWSWQANAGKARQVLETLLPALVGKSDQALVALEAPGNRFNRGGAGRLTQAEIGQQAVAAARLRELKKALAIPPVLSSRRAEVDAMHARMIQMRRAGATLRQIGRAVDRNPATICEVLRRAGLTRSQAEISAQTLSLHTSILEMRRNGAKLSEISRAVGRDRSLVYAVLKRADLVSPKLSEQVIAGLNNARAKGRTLGRPINNQSRNRADESAVASTV